MVGSSRVRHGKHLASRLKALVILVGTACTLAACGGPVPSVPRRVPDAMSCLAKLRATRALEEPRQIPATVIDKGVLRHVPYVSYKLGHYEFNVYGELEAPAGIEMGVYGPLLKGVEGRINCRSALLSMLSDEEDRRVLQSLSFISAKKERKGLTFEVTPETVSDAYGGWWITIYDERLLERSRASSAELKDVTVAKEEVAKIEPESSHAGSDDTSWTREDLRYAREAYRAGVAAVKTELSPPPTSPAARVDDPPPAPPATLPSERTEYTSSTYTPRSYSSGTVYVRGYYRKNGTYVRGHTRRRR